MMISLPLWLFVLVVIGGITGILIAAVPFDRAHGDYGLSGLGQTCTRFGLFVFGLIGYLAVMLYLKSCTSL